MKILIVSGGHLPIPASKGGAVENLITMYLDENEQKFHNNIDVISCPSISNTRKYKYSNIIVIKTGIVGKIYYKIKRILKNENKINAFMYKSLYFLKKSKKQYDLILCENEPDFCIKLNNIYNGKVILHLHNDFLYENVKNYNKVINSTKKIICVSKFIKTRVNSDKAFVCYNGIDYNNFKYDEKKVNDLKNRLNINDNDFVFVYAGRIVFEKGVNELVKSFNKLNKKYKNIKLIIIGAPVFKNKNNNYLYEKIKNDNNENIICTGFIKNNNIKDYYYLSNIQVTPSIVNEAFGLTAVEALATGLRVISTNSGGLPELINSKNGVIIDKENLENNLYDAMENEILNKKSKKIERKYSKENYAETLNNLLIK